MGLLGRYIDALPTGARDRIIEAQLWGMGTLVDAQGNRCLLGHAEDWHYAGSLFRNRAGDPGLQRWRVRSFGASSHLEIGRRFDMLCHRCGVARAVRLVKLRAGRDAGVVVADAPTGSGRRAAVADAPAAPLIG
jgi:hypothetical protein